MKYW